MRVLDPKSVMNYRSPPNWRHGSDPKKSKWAPHGWPSVASYYKCCGAVTMATREHPTRMAVDFSTATSQVSP